MRYFTESRQEKFVAIHDIPEIFCRGVRSRVRASCLAVGILIHRMIIAIVVFVFKSGIGIAITCLVFLSGCTVEDTCQTKVLNQMQSSDGKNTATVLVYECGATTDFSTQVMLSTDNQDPSIREPERIIFSAESYNSNVQVNWLTNSKLKVLYGGPKDSIFVMKEAYKDFQIEYEIENVPPTE